MSDSEDLDRLRQADPTATEPEPDLRALRARVLDDAAATPSAESPLRPRRRSLVVAGGIAAGVALIAAGTLAGVALGRATADDPIIALNDEPAEVPMVNTGPAVSPPRMGGSPMVEDAAVSSMIWPSYSEGFEPAPDLEDVAGLADGYRLTRAGLDTAALARQLADVFEVDGSPRTEQGMVTIGDGSGPTIWVYDDATASWSFSDNTRDPWSCVDSGSVNSEPGIATAEPEALPAPCGTAEVAMPEGEARERAERILSDLGVTTDRSVDVGGMDIGVEWETMADGVITTATAWQTISGERTSLSWSFSFDAQGPLWANGFAAGLEPVPDLPIVGARSAVLRSAEPRWRAFGPTPADSLVRIMDTPAVVDSPSVDGPPSSPEQTFPEQTSIVVNWDPAIVTSASSALAQYWSPDGQFWLLPGYRLGTADDRGEWIIVAVADSAVSFSPALSR